VAIIMDGNGRWATARGLPRSAGHRAGARAVRRAVETAGKLGVGALTLYAFSSDNWQRPRDEVRALMRLFRDYLRRERARCLEHGVRVRVIGRRDRLDPALVQEIEEVERATAGASRLDLRLAVDYSGRDSILRATAGLTPDEPSTRSGLERRIGMACGLGEATRDVDLLLRTGGEQRLSDFLLWECAYAELVFLEVAWPDFGAKHFERALDEFRGRQRRFGRVPEPDRRTGT
jgi:undecaprenyl diphosphate synthase